MRLSHAFFALAFLASASSALADQYVAPYVRQDGTMVEGHFRSSPNGTATDNYSTYGNTNPYTGERGTVHPHSYSAPSYTAPPSYGNQGSQGYSYPRQ